MFAEEKYWYDKKSLILSGYCKNIKVVYKKVVYKKIKESDCQYCCSYS